MKNLSLKVDSNAPKQKRTKKANRNPKIRNRQSMMIFDLKLYEYIEFHK